jgi:hypothetical protein
MCSRAQSVSTTFAAIADRWTLSVLNDGVDDKDRDSGRAHALMPRGGGDANAARPVDHRICARADDARHGHDGVHAPVRGEYGSAHALR